VSRTARGPPILSGSAPPGLNGRSATGIGEGKDSRLVGLGVRPRRSTVCPLQALRGWSARGPVYERLIATGVPQETRRTPDGTADLSHNPDGIREAG
jgi:hypothetical protein